MGTLPVSRKEIDAMCDLIVDALDRLGMSYRRKDGTVRRVEICRRTVTEAGGIVLLEVDTKRLPRGVKVPQLVHPGTLHHLTGVLRRSVSVLNTTGVTYAVDLVPAGARRFPARVDLKELLGARPGGMPHPVCLGVSTEGPVWYSLPKMGHVLAAGSTGSGKSTFLRVLLFQLLLCDVWGQPVRLYLADLEGATFQMFEGIPQLVLPVAEDVSSAEVAAAAVVQELDRRAELFRRAGTYPDDLAEYNRVTGEGLPYLVAVFDEFNALTELAGGHRGRLYRDVQQLALRGRKYGLTLVLAGQDFKANSLGTTLSNQCRTRLQFRAETAVQSRVVLGKAGAEQIPVNRPGRCLARFSGAGKGLVRLQTPWAPKRVMIELGDRLRGGEPPEVPGITLHAREKRMLRYAAERLDGRFPEREICRGVGVSKSDYRTARDRLLTGGYLGRGEKNALVVVRGPDGA